MNFFKELQLTLLKNFQLTISPMLVAIYIHALEQENAGADSFCLLRPKKQLL